MSTDYSAVLNSIRPGTVWSVGETYESLIWMDESAKPTKKTLDDAWPQAQHDLEVAAVQQQRQDRYRAEADPLYFEAARGEDGVTMADWEAKVAQIKAELPYPEAA